jgi:hypothetical protein
VDHVRALSVVPLRIMQEVYWVSAGLVMISRPGIKTGYTQVHDLREIRWIVMDWIDVSQDGNQWRALVNTVMSLRVPYLSG